MHLLLALQLGTQLAGQPACQVAPVGCLQLHGSCTAPLEAPGCLAQTPHSSTHGSHALVPVHQADSSAQRLAMLALLKSKGRLANKLPAKWPL